MNTLKPILLLAALSMLAITGCSDNDASPSKYSLNDYPDVLNISGTPESPTDDSISIFTDHGAWFGFALAEDNNIGFSGPYQLSDSWQEPSMWQGSTFARLQLTNAADGTKLLPQKVEGHSYPGRLRQVIEYEDLTATMTLIFTDAKTALLRTELQNNSEGEKVVKPSWGNILFQEIAETKGNDNLVQIEPGEGSSSFYLTASSPFSFSDSASSYKVSGSKPLTIRSGNTTSRYLAYSRSKKTANIILDRPDKEFQNNNKRWNRYISTLTDGNTVWNQNENRRRVTVKSLQTLINNWRSPKGDLHYNGLFPSYAYQGFHGIWAWDSWKHASALAKFAPKLAKDQLRVMFDYQNKAGMVPDVIYADSSENNWRDTKPPLAGWAVWKIFQETSDTSFLKEMYPKLKRYHRWWYKNRDHDSNGLCEYGSTDGTRIAAAWESGMDNAVRFDEAEMIKNNESAWSLSQESVDLNAYLFAEKNFLAQIADKIGKPKESANFKKEAASLKQKINNQMYDSASGYYYDKKLESDSLITVAGPEGWIPLWAEIASDQQAKEVRTMMMDSSRFRSAVPLPTLQISHPKFNPRNGYWRGPVWLDQFYFGIKGLSNYGFDKEVSTLTKMLLRNAEGLMGSPKPIRENYHPISGEGLNARHFSWSAAHLLMLSQMETLED